MKRKQVSKGYCNIGQIRMKQPIRKHWQPCITEKRVHHLVWWGNILRYILTLASKSSIILQIMYVLLGDSLPEDWKVTNVIVWFISGGEIIGEWHEDSGENFGKKVVEYYNQNWQDTVWSYTSKEYIGCNFHCTKDARMLCC